MDRIDKKILSLTAQNQKISKSILQHEGSLKFIREKILTQNRYLNDLDNRTSVLTYLTTLISEIKKENKKILNQNKKRRSQEEILKTHDSLNVSELVSLKEILKNHESEIVSLSNKIDVLTEISDRLSKVVEKQQVKTQSLETRFSEISILSFVVNLSEQDRISLAEILVGDLLKKKNPLIESLLEQFRLALKDQNPERI